MDACLITLQGQGDIEIMIVTQAVLDWVTNQETPGRNGDESSWIDETPPEILSEIRKEITESRTMTEEDASVHLTSGSFINDRAFYAPSTKIFFNVADAIRHVVKENINIIGSFDGGLY